ncbi:DnaJ-like subfamily C member 3 [Tupanvirus soda lake]|uniref:DnaJ-like subfamily C member 3 n=2 Tax=Tupanvirus TaxID=2094720 RepID=A0A6N1NMM4_9VIRU|nr:DnaJ-like subfamily C member 3 [Tupanvirus soda lake]QKU35240.1 DnaJ-like subfamily C member 3 [Tupanvirus soda lake]
MFCSKFCNFYKSHNYHLRNHFVFARSHSTNIKSLPFKITRQKAQELLMPNNNLMEENIVNKSALVIRKTDPIKECFIPFHSADLRNIRSNYVGKYGIDRIEYYWTVEYNAALKMSMPVQNSRTVTDWYRVSGTLYETEYPFGMTKWSQIYAGFVYPRIIIEEILPITSTDNLKPLIKEMVEFEGTIKIVYPHEMNMSYALEKISGRLYDMEKNRVSEYLLKKYNADRSEILTLDVNLHESNITLHSYYVPAYIYQVDVGYLQKYKVINAYTGDVYGNKIHSAIKMALFGASFGGVTTFLFTALTRPYVFPLHLAFRIIIGSSVSGIISGVFTKFYNRYRHNNIVNQIHDDKKNNFDYMETEDDIERRKFSSFINKNLEYETHNGLFLPVDKLKLLQLDPNEKITLDILKSAYFKQIKKWHPDTHSNKNVAEKMSVQINLAYEELRRIISKQ